MSWIYVPLLYSTEVLCIDMGNQIVHKMDIPFPVKLLNALSHDQWIVSSQDSTTKSVT